LLTKGRGKKKTLRQNGLGNCRKQLPPQSLCHKKRLGLLHQRNLEERPYKAETDLCVRGPAQLMLIFLPSKEGSVGMGILRAPFFFFFLTFFLIATHIQTKNQTKENRL